MREPCRERVCGRPSRAGAVGRGHERSAGECEAHVRAQGSVEVPTSLNRTPVCFMKELAF